MVDDHVLVRQAIGAMLAREGVDIIAEADNGLSAIELACALRPDIVLMDVAMPKMDGIVATHRIKRLVPGVRVLMLTSHVNERRAAEAISAGADGYALKQLGLDELMIALHSVENGKRYLGAGVNAEMVLGYLKGMRAGIGSNLSAREYQVVQMIAQGMSTAEISRALSIALKTADTHRSNAMRKLGVHNSAELVALAICRGIVE